MKLLMYGVNKETVMQEDTEKYFLNEDKKKAQMKIISEFDGVMEIAILTNNFRNEYYLYVDELIFSHGEFLRYLADETNKPLQEIILETYSKFNEDVLRHLFEVSSGFLSDPKGSFNVLESVEGALKFAEYLKTSGDVISKMFKSAICLAYDLKLDSATQPLNQALLSSYVYPLLKEMKELRKKNYLISGSNFEVYFLTKLLLFAGARSVSIIQKNEEVAKKQFQEIKVNLNEVELTKVYFITSKSLYYRLSTMDAAILDTSEINILSKEIQNEVSIIRQTKKVQYLVDTNELEMNEEAYSELDLRVIKNQTEVLFSEEELENAMDVFEEKLTSYINQFMEFLNNTQVNSIEEPLLN